MTEEFEGNVKIVTSPSEVRLWICNEDGCRFRLKAIGTVVRNGTDIIVIAKDSSHDKMVAALKAALENVLAEIALNTRQRKNYERRKAHTDAIQST